MLHLATIATYEQSFNLVKLIWVDLRSKITDERMNHLSIMKYYPDFLIGINIEDIISEFAIDHDLRIKQFGYVKRD